MRTFQRIARLIGPAVGLPLLAGLGLAGLVLMALGCGEEAARPAAAAPAVNPRLPDVPVPAGFKFQADQSTERRVRGFRFVRHYYNRSRSRWSPAGGASCSPKATRPATSASGTTGARGC